MLLFSLQFLRSIRRKQVREQPLELRRVAVDPVIQLDRAGGLIAATPHGLGERVIFDRALGAQKCVKLLDRRADLAGGAWRIIQHLAWVEKEQALIKRRVVALFKVAVVVAGKEIGVDPQVAGAAGGG